jgi:hypothetical protein
MPPAGFEDRDDHRTACASLLSQYKQHPLIRLALLFLIVGWRHDEPYFGEKGMRAVRLARW